MARFRPAWEGHLLLFPRRGPPLWDGHAGARLLAAVVMLELVIGPRVSTLRALGLPEVSPYIRVPLLLASALALARWFARVPWRELGLRPWHDWAESEKWYFVEVVLLANIVFALLYGQRLQAPPWMALSFLWGFHQEVVYRGMLQGELTRRLGSAAGVALSNLLFTFGPLHWYHFARGPAAAPMFLAIFLVGLYLGILQLRSRNLWMVGTFHGIGTAWILSATAPAG